MPQTILSHMLCLMNYHNAPFKDAVSLTATRFKVPQVYVETLFSRGV